jgi:hypothetical protein
MPADEVGEIRSQTKNVIQSCDRTSSASSGDMAPKLRSLVIAVAAVGCADDPVVTPDAHVDTMIAPPPDAQLRGYGETCATATDCQSGICLGTCSRSCTLAIANDCRDVNAFCARVGVDQYACAGEIETFDDPDDSIMAVGDSLLRTLTPLTDADLFEVRLNQLGTITIKATPAPTIDLQLEAYGTNATQIGVVNDGGAGVEEGATTDAMTVTGYIWVVVRNVGTSTGNYRLSVTRQ